MAITDRELPADESERLARLLALGVLDSGREAAFDALVAGAAAVTGCAMAALSLVDARRVWFKAAYGLALPEIARQDAFCDRVVADAACLEVGDARGDARFAHSVLVRDEPHLRFYAGAPLRADGMVLGALCVMDAAPRALDATQRACLEQLAALAVDLLRTAEQRRALHAERARLHDLARASGDWMWETDRELRYRWISGDFEALTGLYAADLIGVAIEDAAVLDDDGRARAGGLSLHALLHRRDPLRRVLTAKTTPRGLLMISRSAVPVLDVAGRFVGWRGTSRDVSAAVRARQAEQALRRSELRWEHAAEAAGIGVAELDVASGELHFDARACANHGLPFPHPRFTQDDWLASIEEADRDAAREAVRRALEPGGSLLARYRMHHPDGTLHHLEVTAQVVRDATGQPLEVLGTCRDVSEQVAADALRFARVAAEEANRAKSELLSRVSHELRTPLNGILGFAQLMALDDRQPLPSEQRQRLEGIRHSGAHLLALIDDLLELGRIEQHGAAAAAVPVDLAATLQAALVMLQPLARTHDVHLPPVPLEAARWVHTDARGLEQILLNLLSNAVKYNRRGGSVGLDVHVDGARVRVAVRDQGEGLDEGQIAQLFQPFKRLGAQQRQVVGSGLGLVIAHELARAMGARIEVTNRPGDGATFCLDLALAPTPPARPALALDVPPSPSLASTPAATARVLYIEDEPLNVVLMQEVFRGHPQWQLAVAGDAREGLALAHRHRPDLLLVDMNLPDAHGLELIGRLRADPVTARTACVALSADAMPEQIRAALDAGFDDYWTKPIDVPTIIAALADRLERGSAKR